MDTTEATGICSTQLVLDLTWPQPVANLAKLVHTLEHDLRNNRPTTTTTTTTTTTSQQFIFPMNFEIIKQPLFVLLKLLDSCCLNEIIPNRSQHAHSSGAC